MRSKRPWSAVATAVFLAAGHLVAPRPVAAQTDRAPAQPQVTETTLRLEGGSTLRYAIALPDAYSDAEEEQRPLVVALHPGGSYEYYGSEFMRSIVEPALRSWGAVVVAPDVPDGSWATLRAERAVLALVQHVVSERSIDPARVLVTGYSMGGRGTWYMAARHPEVFTGAIVMAGAPGRADLDDIDAIPLYLINSPSDEVIPFESAEQAYLTLSERGHPIEMRVLPGISHYSMGAYIPALRLAGEWMLERWSAAARER